MAKGNFIEYVVSDNPNKYPDGGEQGGYYYEVFDGSGQYVWGKYNAVIGLGESTNNIALANDGTSIDTYVEENLYIKEDGTIGIQGEPYSTVAISSVMEGSFVGGTAPVKYCVGVDGSVYYSPVSNSEGSVDNCTAKPVIAVKGDFVDFAVSDSSTAYPDGGEQDGYWYEKVVELHKSLGFSKMTFGTFTKTSDSYSIGIITHNLGVKPKLIFIYTHHNFIGKGYSEKYVKDITLWDGTAPISTQNNNLDFSGTLYEPQLGGLYPEGYRPSDTFSNGASFDSNTFAIDMNQYIKGGQPYYYLVLA